MLLNENSDQHFYCILLVYKSSPFNMKKFQKNSWKGKKINLKACTKHLIQNDTNHDLEGKHLRNILSWCCLKLHDFSQIMYQIVLNTRLSIYQVFFKYFLKNPCFQLCHNVLMTWHAWLMPVQADIGTEQLRKVLNKLSSYFFFLRNHLKPTWDKMPGVNLGHIGLYLESVWFYV